MSKRRCVPPSVIGWLKVVTALIVIMDGVPAAADMALPEAVTEVAAAGGRHPEQAFELAAAGQRLPESALELIVTVTLNGEVRGDFFLVRDASGRLLIRREDAMSLGLPIPGEAPIVLQGQTYLQLSAVQDVSVTFDEKRLTLTIIGKTVAAGTTVIDLEPPGGPRSEYSPQETSGFFNYALTAFSQEAGASPSFRATSKLGISRGEVSFVSDAEYEVSGETERFTRLMSSLTYERREELQRLVLGDQFAGVGSFGPTLNLAGVGISKVYAMDPYLSTRPRFDLGGAAAFPSQAEIYLDGRRIGEYRIPAGEFEIQNLSAFGGAHSVEVLLRDPFGNERRISFQEYFSDTMLDSGLHEYSYNAGFLREEYGQASNEYGKPVFSAFHRYGASSALNLGMHAQGGDGCLEGGLQMSSLVPRLGQMTLDLAGSTADTGDGWSAAFRHTYRLGSFGANLYLHGGSQDFVTVGAQPGADPLELEAGVGLGYSYRRWGTLSLGWSDSQRHSGDDIRTTWATYTNEITPRSTLFLTARVVDEAENDFQLTFGYTLRLQKDTQISVNLSKAGDVDRQSAQIQKYVPQGEGLGYRVYLERQHGDGAEGDAYAFNPSLQYNARYGTLLLNPHVESGGGRTTEGYEVTAAGSLVYAGGFFGLSRPVNESFAFVMADSLDGAAVLLHGEDVGRTASNGRLVIPNLTPYYANEISLDAGDLPMDLSVSEMKAKILPGQWGGSCVSFDVVPMRAVFGTMTLGQGQRRTPLEYREMTLRVGDRDVVASLAKGGEFYLENLLPPEPSAGGPDPRSCSGIAARLAAGSPVIKPGTYRGRVGGAGEQGCDFELTFPDTADVMTDVGEIVCSAPEIIVPAGEGRSSEAPFVAPAAPVPAPLPAPVQGTAAAETPAPDRSFEKTLPEAFATIFGLWQLDALADDVRHWTFFNFKEKLLPVYFEETGLTSTYGMEFALLPATLESLVSTNLPCLALEAAGAQGPRYVVFAGFEGDQAVVLGPGGESNEVPAAAWLSSVKDSLICLVPKAEVPETPVPGGGGPDANP